MVEFVGRDVELEALHEQLTQSSTVAISAIAGMGGIGKTELALQYALKYRDLGAYAGGLCWLRAREEIGTQIVEFARSRLSRQPPDDWELLPKVMWCWQNWAEETTLIIFDDVQNYAEIKPFLPVNEPRFKILLTTRSHFGSPVKDFEIKVLSEAAALDLLRSIVQDDRIDQDLATAKQVCDWLGYLPLGLELVARYLVEDEDLSLQDLWQELQDQRVDAEALKQVEPGMTASLGVVAAFELSWKKLTLEAQQVAALLSLFASAPLSWELVQACLPGMNEQTLKKLRNKQLLGLHLLDRVGQDMYQLHPLLREFFGAKREQMVEANEMKKSFYREMVAVARQIPLLREFFGAKREQIAKVDEMKRSFCRVMVAEGQQIPPTPTLSIIAQMTPAIPHLKEAATTLNAWLADDGLIEPSTRIAWFYKGQSAFTDAEEWNQQCRAIAEQRLGGEHPAVANSLNNLALLYYSQGRYSEAELLCLQALEIVQHQLGSEHPAVANSLNNLAGLYKSQGRYGEAEPLYLQALEIVQHQLGSEHPAVANSLNNLAGLYHSQGRYGEAEPLYLQALEIRQHQLGSEHPAVANSLNNLALLYHSQGRYGEAEPLYLQALEIRQHQLGSEHPHVATSLNNLAGLYESQGRYGEAEPLYLQALEIVQHQLGSEHPHVATSLNNLALLYYSQGRYGEAEPLYLQALEIRQNQLGGEHPDVAASFNNLAELYRLQGRYGEAEPLYLQALPIVFTKLGADHPTTQTVQRNFLSFLQQVIQEDRIAELSDHPHTQQLVEQIQAQINQENDSNS